MHGTGPGPLPSLSLAHAPSAWQPPSSGASIDASIVQLDGHGVLVQPPARLPLPRIVLNDTASGWRIDAAVWHELKVTPSGTQEHGVAVCLDHWQHEALAQLLRVPASAWTSRDISPAANGTGCILEFTVADPRPRPEAATTLPPNPPQINLRLNVQGENGKPQQVVSIDLTDDDGHTTSLPASRVNFAATPGLPYSAHVPQALLDQTPLLARSEGKIAFARQDDGTLLSRHRVDAATRNEVELRLSPDPVLGGWRVSLVHERPCAHGPLRLHPQCRLWLQAGENSPAMPPALVAMLANALDNYAHRVPLGDTPVTIFDPLAMDPQTPVYPSVVFDCLVPLDATRSRNERWSGAVYLMPQGDGWRIPQVHFKSPGVPFGRAVVQPNSADWINPIEGRLSTLLAQETPDNITAIRGWPLTISRAFAVAAWDTLSVEPYRRLGLEDSSDSFRELSSAGKIYAALDACREHQGTIVREVEQREMTFGFKRVAVAQREVDVWVRVRNRYLGRELRVTGVKLVPPDDPAQLRSLQIPTFRMSQAQTRLATAGGRVEALKSRAIYSRWEIVQTPHERDARRIFTEIVKVCSEARASGVEWHPHDHQYHLYSMEVPFYGVPERFYLRFSDKWCDEVVDVRVKEVRVESGWMREEGENAVLDKLRSAANQGEASRATRWGAARVIAPQ